MRKNDEENDTNAVIPGKDVGREKPSKGVYINLTGGDTARDRARGERAGSTLEEKKERGGD